MQLLLKFCILDLYYNYNEMIFPSGKNDIDQAGL